MLFPRAIGKENLMPLGVAANAARLQLEPSGNAPAESRASVAVNSVGLLDLVQIAAKGLPPQTTYQVYLAESNHPPFGKLEPLAVLKTNPYGWSIVQAIGPLKALAGDTPNSSRRSDFCLLPTCGPIAGWCCGNRTLRPPHSSGISTSCRVSYWLITAKNSLAVGEEAGA